MTRFMNEEVTSQVREALAGLARRVRLIHFTQKSACGACREQRELLEEFAALSDMLELEVYELVSDAAEAKRYAIDKVPATAVVGEHDYGIRFYGLTGGYEFGSLLEAVLMVAGGHSGLDPEVETAAQRITVPVHLEIMVTLSCPYCPRMVRFAHQLAFANEHVRADMIDAAEFPTLAQRYQVQGVPRTVVNERPAFEGALPAGSAVLEILKQVDPEAYEVLDATQRSASGVRKASGVQPENEYDVAVVGAGPAALSAALYATRKNRSVALLGTKPGGQVSDTASVENYLGMMEVGGAELAEMFRHHLESYPVAERLHTRVVEVRRAGHSFELQVEDGSVFRAKSVVYAAGKQYRRLGVPGEARFIGHGIAFCATCDAPLYRNKRVAVVGGGNSAFTAARDLMGFAREVHLIHMLGEFQADSVLVEQVRKADNVALHMKTEVREFLGSDALSGVRLASTDGKRRYDLLVDGVFLEVGLMPNTEPVAKLLERNAAGEIPVGRDQSTSVLGLFAAGDATDQRDKQIIIAAGDGAQAALTADRFLGSGRAG